MTAPVRNVVLTSCVFPETNSHDEMTQFMDPLRTEAPTNSSFAEIHTPNRVVQLMAPDSVRPSLTIPQSEVTAILTKTISAGVICGIISVIFANTFAISPAICAVSLGLTILVYTGFCGAMVLSIEEIFSNTLARVIRVIESQKKSFVVMKAPEAILKTYSQFHEFVRQFRQDYSLQQRNEIGNFFERRTIPSTHYTDPIFMENICSITGVPIRHPVKEPVTNKIYERAAIEAWINLHHTSPMTLQPIEKQSLIPVPEIEDRINNHLQKIQKELDEFAKLFPYKKD
jgi:hypothetical protein